MDSNNNTIVEETQEKSTFNPNLDLEGDAWLDWIMFECVHIPVIPETQLEVEEEGENHEEEGQSDGSNKLTINKTQEESTFNPNLNE